MCIRAVAISIFLLVLLSVTGYGQSRWHASLKAYPTVSTFAVNTKSTQYDKALDRAQCDFKNKVGCGCGAGVEYDLTEKITAFTDIRYNVWGGKIHIGDPADPKFYIDLNVKYRSINVPIGLRYYVLNKTHWRLSLSAGTGIDHSFKESFIPSNYYGTFSAIQRNTNITTWYVLLGAGVEFKLSNRLIGILGFEVNNDMALNPNRMQDIGGYYAQQMPLKYNLMALTIGVKI